jgi:hypothetical protein
LRDGALTYAASRIARDRRRLKIAGSGSEVREDRMAIVSVRDLLKIAVMIAALAIPAVSAQAQDRKPDWREQNAYTLGVQAYLYAFPWAYMPLARWQRTDAMRVPAGALAPARQLVNTSELARFGPGHRGRLWEHGLRIQAAGAIRNEP